MTGAACAGAALAVAANHRPHAHRAAALADTTSATAETPGPVLRPAAAAEGAARAEPRPVPPPPARPKTRARAESETGEVLDEPGVLALLHDLAASDPPRSLQLAREAVERFPDSPDAPELEWNVVKALFNMGRLDEAKEEARVMVEEYPGSSFTGDVEHHLLHHPPNPP